ncbi:hypothetical protein FOA52_012320 [Chlamydomonas sp. UWO 241]|nr:hypothetical protein FOA52_012320 [Chlamydomonas sp. UWO 241]
MGGLSTFAFGFIDTSNVADHVGLLNMLGGVVPARLARHLLSRLRTESMLWTGFAGNMEEYLDSTLGLPLTMHATLLGLRLVTVISAGPSEPVVGSWAFKFGHKQGSALLWAPVLEEAGAQALLRPQPLMAAEGGIRRCLEALALRCTASKLAASVNAGSYAKVMKRHKESPFNTPAAMAWLLARSCTRVDWTSFSSPAAAAAPESSGFIIATLNPARASSTPSASMLLLLRSMLGSADDISSALMSRAGQTPAVHIINALACSIDRDTRTSTVSFLLPQDLGRLQLAETLVVLVHLDSGFMQMSAVVPLTSFETRDYHCPGLMAALLSPAGSGSTGNIANLLGAPPSCPTSTAMRVRITTAGSGGSGGSGSKSSGAGRGALTGGVSSGGAHTVDLRFAWPPWMPWPYDLLVEPRALPLLSPASLPHRTDLAGLKETIKIFFVHAIKDSTRVYNFCEREPGDLGPASVERLFLRVHTLVRRAPDGQPLLEVTYVDASLAQVLADSRVVNLNAQLNDFQDVIGAALQGDNNFHKIIVGKGELELLRRLLCRNALQCKPSKWQAKALPHANSGPGTSAWF